MYYTSQPDAAEEEATAVPVQQRGVGFMFQSFALFKHMTVGENIAFGPRIRKEDVNIEQRYACANMGTEIAVRSLCVQVLLLIGHRLLLPWHASEPVRASLSMDGTRHD